MTKVVYVALDERPCNKDFPLKIAISSDVSVVGLPKEVFGYKERGASFERIEAFVNSEIRDARYLILSLDMWLYGGLVPSRVHQFDQEELESRLEKLKILKETYPDLKIFAFSTIMRVTQYNSMDCETEYSKEYGAAIFKTGYLTHKEQLVGLTEEEYHVKNGLVVPKEYLVDFLTRRKKNLELILSSISYLEEGIFCSYSVMQDDSSPYGYTAMDQEVIQKKVKQLQKKDQFFMYPGADEVGMVLLTKVVLELLEKKPQIYVLYPGPTCGNIIPNLEDRTLDGMVTHQLHNIGAIRVESIQEADAIFYIHAPADKMISTFSDIQTSRGIDVLINSIHALEVLKYYKKEYGKHIFVSDVTFGNGSKLEIYHLLQQFGLLDQIDAFAGWNTAANTVGSTLAQGICGMYLGKVETFLYERFLEDVGYCGYVRQDLSKTILPNYQGIAYFDFSAEKNAITSSMRDKLQVFLQEDLAEIASKVEIDRLDFVWNRLYEIDLTLKTKNG